MKYYLDCEFDGFGGALISLALVSEAGPSLYLVFDDAYTAKDPWVRENVLPIIPLPIAAVVDRLAGQVLLARFLRGDEKPVIVADWPDDIKYLCELMITAPGEMISVPRMAFEMHRVDSYPTDLPGAVQHNAWWDAKALQAKLSDGST